MLHYTQVDGWMDDGKGVRGKGEEDERSKIKGGEGGKAMKGSKVEVGRRER